MAQCDPSTSITDDDDAMHGLGRGAMHGAAATKASIARARLLKS